MYRRTDCEIKSDCHNDCESCEYAKILEKQEQDRQALCVAVEGLGNAISEMLDPLVNAIDNFMNELMPVIKNAVDYIVAAWDSILQIYPNKRILYLATKHPKKRVRKKNMHRIMKDIRKELKNEKHQKNI